MTPLRKLVRAHGWAFSAEQAANPEMRAWTTSDDAGVAYVPARRWPLGPRVRVAAGDPLAPRDALRAVAAAFEDAAAAQGEGVVWFGASAALGTGRAGLVLGAEPVLDASRWAETVRQKASLRAQIARARNKGVRVRALPDDASLATYRPILAAWLGTRGMPPLHFLAQPSVLDAPGDRRFWVAERAGTAVALLALCPVGARPAALVEWILRRPDAPNGTASLLVDAAVRAEAERGTRDVSLGLVPLSTRAPLSSAAPSLPAQAALAWTRAHARRFYRFDGLEQFKAKFQPARWEPVYLFTTQRRVDLGTLYAVADAFAGPRSPERLVARALTDALADEARALASRR